VFKSKLTNAQVLELGDNFIVLYKGYSIYTTDMKTQAIMTAINQEECDRLLDQKAITYLKQA